MNKNSELQNEVLFQKLGNRWYVFSEVENDFIYSPLPEGINPKTTKLELFEVIENHIIRVSQQLKKTDTKNVAA
tara:strand:- start:2 stop:223 length:222 start_codon:yes stop_codon:yes gene_type:complete